MAERLASRTMREVFSKFFADRGTHLAAMIAYFALLSFVPLVFLALAFLGFAGRADESSYLVTELNKAFPTSSVESIVRVVRSVQDQALKQAFDKATSVNPNIKVVAEGESFYTTRGRRRQHKIITATLTRPRPSAITGAEVRGRGTRRAVNVKGSGHGGHRRSRQAPTGFPEG